MLYLIPLIITFSLIFYKMKTPLSMGLILFIQTILIAMLTGAMTFSYWFSYILFLIFLGGMLILFIYISSLSSNNMYKYNFSINVYLMASLLLLIMLLFLDPTILPTSVFSSSLYSISAPHLATKWIYSKSFKAITLFIITYLLITLIVVVKNSSMIKGPLRLLN